MADIRKNNTARIWGSHCDVQILAFCHLYKSSLGAPAKILLKKWLFFPMVTPDILVSLFILYLHKIYDNFCLQGVIHIFHRVFNIEFSLKFQWKFNLQANLSTALLQGYPHDTPLQKIYIIHTFPATAVKNRRFFLLTDSARLYLRFPPVLPERFLCFCGQPSRWTLPPGHRKRAAPQKRSGSYQQNQSCLTV